MVLNNKELKTLHEIELEMFKEFINVCEKLNIKYFCLGGTVLGAVRHKGFIPWDDDIDVGMPREDFEKFIAQGQKELPSHLFIQTTQTDKKYRNHFAKIRNCNTTFIEESTHGIKMNQGIYIDIFPLDGIGNDEKEVDKNNSIYRKLHEIYLHIEGKYSKKGIRNKIRNVYYEILSVQYRIFVNLEKKIQNQCSKIKYNDCNYICNYFGMWREKEISEKEWFSDGEILEFEQVKVRVPKKYNKYLCKMYGDYMKLPPVEKRIAPHCHILDATKSYKYYLSEKTKKCINNRKKLT